MQGTGSEHLFSRLKVHYPEKKKDLPLTSIAIPNRSSPSAYEFYQETLNLVIVMMSTQLQLTSSESNEKNYFLNIVLQKFGQVADQLTLRLLWNFTDQKPSPPLTGSIVYSAYSYLFAKAGSSPSSEAHPIADRSILLLLLLLSQAKSNPDFDIFRKSIHRIRDERGNKADQHTSVTLSVLASCTDHMIMSFLDRFHGRRPEGGHHFHVISQNLPRDLPVSLPSHMHVIA